MDGPDGSLMRGRERCGLHGGANIAHHVEAKHALVGLMRVLAIELGPSSVRVNCVHPTEVNTPMVMNEQFLALLCPDVPDPVPRIWPR